MDRPARGCQFVVPEDELIGFDGEDWCIYHLPLRVDEVESPKSHWADARVKAFNDSILELIRSVKDADHFLNLTGVVFPKEIVFSHLGEDDTMPKATFESAQFGGSTSFGNCAFTTARFSNATFFDNVAFARTTFKYADFSGTRFCKWASFTGAELNGAAFVDATFGGEASFNDARFIGPSAIFSFARFRSRAMFTDVVFSGDAFFQHVTFDDVAWFLGNATGEGASRGADTFPRSVVFRNANFRGRANFANRRFLGATDFRNATFQLAPEFHNAVLHQNTDFSGARFLDRIGADYVNAAMAYRTLKLAMESVRARDEEARFYGYEQQSLRARKDTPWSVKLFSWLYEKTAFYGQSLVRPLCWLLGLFVAFFLVYLAIMHDAPTITWTDGQEVLRFALQQVFQPFGAFRASLGQSDADQVPLGLSVVAAFHSILTFTLLTLFLLALRRRFRLN
jgi:uncharacterized protein YjbI with pentapeptide repeats